MDIKKLAALARLKLTPKEEDSFSKEFEAILGYVDQIKKADIKDLKDASEDDIQLLNVMREDDESNLSGKETEKLISLSPDRDGDYIKVKKIL